MTSMATAQPALRRFYHSKLKDSIKAKVQKTSMIIWPISTTTISRWLSGWGGGCVVWPDLVLSGGRRTGCPPQNFSFVKFVILAAISALSDCVCNWYKIQARINRLPAADLSDLRNRVTRQLRDRQLREVNFITSLGIWIVRLLLHIQSKVTKRKIVAQEEAEHEVGAPPMPLANIQVSLCQPLYSSKLKPKPSLSYLTNISGPGDSDCGRVDQQQLPHLYWPFPSWPAGDHSVGWLDIYIQHRNKCLKWKSKCWRISLPKKFKSPKQASNESLFLQLLLPGCDASRLHACCPTCLEGWLSRLKAPHYLTRTPLELFTLLRHSTCPVCRQSLRFEEEEEEMGYGGGDEDLDDDGPNM